VIAAADVNPLITGNGMKSITKPVVIEIQIITISGIIHTVKNIIALKINKGVPVTKTVAVHTHSTHHIHAQARTK